MGLGSSTTHSTQEWLAPPHALTLHDGDVHVWRGIVDIPPSDLQVYWEILNSDEQQRSARLRFQQHQRRFTAAHGILRSLLGYYLEIPPQEVNIGIGSHGKPFVENLLGPKLYFNISHSQRVALFAFTREAELGIDVEGPKPRLDYQSVAKRILNPQEQEWLDAISTSQQKAAFLACWTRKEAFVKAYGTGLTFPFRNLTVTFQPDQLARIVKIDDPELNVRPWDLFPVYPRHRYFGALVVAGHAQAVHYWDYQPWKSQFRP